MITKGITLEKPTPLGLYFGCLHEAGNQVLPCRTPVRTVTYNMETFFVSCIALYKTLAPANMKFKVAPTPFILEGQDVGPAGNPAALPPGDTSQDDPLSLV